MSDRVHTDMAIVITDAKTPAHKINKRDASIAASKRARQLHKLLKQCKLPRLAPASSAHSDCRQHAFDREGYAASASLVLRDRDAERSGARSF